MIKIFNKNKKDRMFGFKISLLIAVVLLGLTWTKSFPTKSFPIGEIFTVTSGDSVRDIAGDLEEQGFVRSAQWFMFLLKVSDNRGLVVSGDYIFDKPVSTFGIVNRVSRGDYGPTQMKLTIPEGTTVAQVAEIASSTVSGFDVEGFLEIADSNEGYLFPDTYQIFPSVTPEQLLETLTENFSKKVTPLFDELEVPVEDRDRIIILASIVEREAFGDNYEEHRIVAGIMEKRMKIGMPLQVDATLHYLLGKTSKQLTKTDLKYDSPYNTYVNKGLPPGPISSPGLVAIKASINAKTSDYLFYLHGSDGRIHYAVTHDQHVANKRAYLK